MRVLVVTVVHRPDDARIRHREIAALLSAGVEVVYAAPFSGWGVSPVDVPGLSTVDLPRAHGRHRFAAARAARRLLRHPHADVVLVHDPELVPWAAGARRRATVVWDVHEDTAAALTLKAWLPAPLRGPVAALVRGLERWAERRVHLLLAEDGYRTRFAAAHPVVPNSTPVPAAVPPPDRPVAVYVGHLTRARGAEELVEVGRLLAGSGVELHVVGHADGPTAAALEGAREHLTWHGFLPNASALELVDGATAGLSLLHDEPNYRHSRPTKVLEYMARGVPVVTTPTPPARTLVERDKCGVVVPFGDAAAAAEAVLALHRDDARRRTMGTAGHVAALRDHDWNADATRFVDQLRTWASA